MAEFEGRLAVVTGGTRGIGLAVASALAGAGAFVVVTGRDAAAGDRAIRLIEESGGQSRFISADQADPAGWAQIADAVAARPERWDVLVLNAGVSGPSPLAATSLQHFREVCDVNLRGAYVGLQHGVAGMRAHGAGGSVVLMASIVGRIGVPAHIAYGASKGGLRLLAKAAALELGSEQIRVNSVHPGLIRTDMTAGFDEAALSERAPAGRFGQPSEVAAAVLFLASDRARYITGTEVVVDGGWLAR